jgi:hypothetical protein
MDLHQDVHGEIGPIDNISIEDIVIKSFDVYGSNNLLLV